MSPKEVFGPELEKFKNYLRSNSVENAKRALLYPLFQKLFKDRFKIENDAKGADVFIDGQLIVESKTDYKQWIEAVFQSLHYHRKFGLGFHTIMVVAKEFVGIWKTNKLPEEAIKLSYQADAGKAPNLVGKELAKKCDVATIKAIHDSALYWLEPKDLQGDIFKGARNLTTESYEVLKILRNLDSDRLLISTHNFIDTIERMKAFFPSAIQAIHAFYTIVAFWDITSSVSVNEDDTAITVTGFKGKRHSSPIPVHRNQIQEITRFIETQYVFTNEGSGLTVDYYFGRFDEVLAKMDPDYVKQHGIFFTNNNLSKFALWFAKQEIEEDLNENYIVFDPAAGSGNLVSSWKGKLKHKIVSELQPDLLKVIERRMKADPWHVEHGFTIVPKTSNNEGLNFLDVDAVTYFSRLQEEVKRNNVVMDKPLAFLLNPPYKNTDENVSAREATKSEYVIHPSILELTGEDAGKERYLAFLGQILNMAKAQAEEIVGSLPLVMIFTPTSWLLPRPTYQNFRDIWDMHFEYHAGFIITSNEFFKLEGKWPLAFTIWRYKMGSSKNNNSVVVKDLTDWRASDLNIVWEQEEEKLNKEIKTLLKGKPRIRLDNSRGDIKDLLPLIQTQNGNLVSQTRLNIYRSRLKSEKEDKIISGFPLSDSRHFNIKAPYGYTDGTYIGFMDDCTPVRIRMDAQKRLSNLPDRVWFYLDNRMIKINLCKAFASTPDKYGFCAYNLENSQYFFSWFSIAKVLVGNYPLWANQYDIWPPEVA